MTKEFEEELAAHCHFSWSEWVRYMFSKCTMSPDGELIIPRWAVDRWMRQMETPYEDLPEEEKELDRIEARFIMRTLERALSRERSNI